MNQVLTNVALVLVFVLVGGVFAASEIALVSLRESQIKGLGQRGRRGERVARLAADPNRFLSAVQIGVTLMGFLSAAVGGATLSGELSPVLVRWGLTEPVADVVALVAVTLAIAYASILLGELVPKRLALQRAEGTALLLAPVIDRIAILARPVIWLLGRNADFLVRLLGGNPDTQREQITSEELREMVSAHETLGEEERRIVEDVFAAGERQVREVMLPRTEVDFLDADTPVYKAVRMVADKPHSRYPVVRDTADDVVGFVHVRDLMDPDVATRGVRVGELARDVLVLPGTKRVLPALTDLRRTGSHLAIVADEYGGTAGIVTLEDLVEELVGDIRDEYDRAEEPHGPATAGGPVEVEGLLNLEDFAEETGVELVDGPYETVAGYVVAHLGHVPGVGESVDVDGHRLEVLELDGLRVSRLRLTAVPPTSPVPDEGDVQASAASSAERTPTG